MKKLSPDIRLQNHQISVREMDNESKLLCLYLKKSVMLSYSLVTKIENIYQKWMLQNIESRASTITHKNSLI